MPAGFRRHLEVEKEEKDEEGKGRGGGKEARGGAMPHQIFWSRTAPGDAALRNVTLTLAVTVL